MIIFDVNSLLTRQSARLKGCLRLKCSHVSGTPSQHVNSCFKVSQKMTFFWCTMGTLIINWNSSQGAFTSKNFWLSLGFKLLLNKVKFWTIPD